MPKGGRAYGLWDVGAPPPDAAPAPYPGEVASAAWDQTFTARVIEMATERAYEPDPTFKPDMKGLEPRFYKIYDDLAEAKSLEHFRAIQTREVKAQDQLQTIMEGGVGAVAKATAMDLLDPTLLPFWFLPGGNAFRSARASNRIAKMNAVVMGELGARELASLHAQPSKTFEDILPVMMTGAALGTGIGAIMRPSLRGAPMAQKDRLVGELQKAHDEAAVDASESLSAASASIAYGSPAKLSKEKALTPKWVKATSGYWSPKTRLAHSADSGLAEPSAAVDELVRTEVRRARSQKGESPRYPAGRLNPLEEEVVATRDQLAAYSTAMVKSFRKVMQEQHGIKMSKSEAEEYISRAAAYGDETVEHSAVLPIIKDFRDVKMAIAKRGEAVGMFGKDGLKAHLYNKHHGHRLYDKAKILAQPDVFMRAVVRGYQHNAPARPLAELEERARNAMNNIVANHKNMPGDGGGSKHFGPAVTKHITVKVNDEFIEDFLIRNASEELSHLSADFVPIMTTLERYGPKGVKYVQGEGLVITEIKDRLVNEFVERRAGKLDKEGNLIPLDGETLAKMQKAHDGNLRDIQHIINKITGMDRAVGNLDKKWVAGLGEIRAYTNMAWLGNAPLASAHELLQSATISGFTNTAKAIGLMFNPGELAKANIRQLRAMSMGLDTAIAHSTNALRADLDEAVGLRGAGSFARRHADKIFLYSGMNHLVRATKDIHAFSFMTDLVDHALGKQAAKVGSGTYESAMGHFTQMGIRKADFKRIAKEVENGGIVQEKGVWVIDVDKVTDEGIINRVMSSTAGQGHRAVVGTGAGEVPILLDNPIGKAAVQFKRVFFGYSQRLSPLAYRVSQGDARAISGMVGVFGVAWMAYQVRMLAKFMSEDPENGLDKFMEHWETTAIQDHVREAIERSGYTGMLFEMFSQADQVANGGLSYYAALNQGTKHFNRRASLLGNMVPSLSYAEKALRTFGSPFQEGGITKTNVKDARSLMLMGTLPYVDPFLDAISRASAQTLEEGKEKERRMRQKTAPKLDY
jgi:hypothetical protein